MSNVDNTQAPSFLMGYSTFLQLTRTTIISRMSSKFGQIGPRTAELAALERLEKSPYTFNGENGNGENVVNTLAPLFLIGSSSYLQVIRTIIRVRTSISFQVQKS